MEKILPIPVPNESPAETEKLKKHAKNIAAIWVDEVGGNNYKLKKGKTRHATKAARIMNGKSELYVPALISVLLLVNDKPLTLEDVLDFDLQVYNKIVAKMDSVNLL